jgi:signal transduction histidine kinase
LILAFALVVLFVVCSVAGTLLLILRQNPQEERLMALELVAQARLLTNVIRRLPDVGPGGPDDFERLRRLAENEELRIAWAVPGGRIVFDSEDRWTGMETEELQRRLRRVNEGRSSGIIRADGVRWMVAAQPVPNPPAEPEAVLILARPAPVLSFLRRFRETLARPLLQAGTAALILGIILSLIISHSIARPLGKVAGAAGEIAAGNLDARAPVEGPTEARRVAEAFNAMASQVQAGRQAQRELVANIAHDLRTPLTSIQGYAQALMDGTAATPQAQRQAATAIHEESQRLHRMTSALLDLARFEAGQVELAQEPVDLGALVRRRAEIARVQAQEAGIDLTVTAPAPGVIARGDEARLAQVLDNLLSNALAHTPAGGQVAIGVAARGRWAVVTVADTGAGIPEAEMPRIFERFYRGDRARRGPGTGLGLAIVREIVNAHGGTIEVESVVGEGSVFRVRLPGEHES